MRLRSPVVIAATGIAVAGFTVHLARTQQAATPALPKSQYVNPAVCASCHRDQASGFRKTGMGRSFYRLRPDNATEDFTPGRPFYHEASGTYIEMLQRGGEYYQRRWQKGFDGAEDQYRRKAGRLRHGFGQPRAGLPSPDQPEDAAATAARLVFGEGRLLGDGAGIRPAGLSGLDPRCDLRVHVLPQCLSGNPEGHEETGASPELVPPIPEGIDCQRCHGPGQRHVKAAQTPARRRSRFARQSSIRGA